MATSPNFNWPEPDNTDLVKNGALAIRTAVNAIDTSLVDLKGGTTGQVLAKASGTDMDFSWVAQDDSNAIQNAIVDAKGDLIAATANDTPARLAVGSDYAILQSLASETTGLKWGGKRIAYTPTWGVVSGTAPTIGNGAIAGSYVRTGDTVYFAIKIQFGTTTTAGSGIYTFGLPIATLGSELALTGLGTALDAGVAWYRGYFPNTVESAYTDKFVLTNAAGNSISNSHPMTFGTDDQIYAWGVYAI